MTTSPVLIYFASIFVLLRPTAQGRLPARAYQIYDRTSKEARRDRKTCFNVQQPLFPLDRRVDERNQNWSSISCEWGQVTAVPLAMGVPYKCLKKHCLSTSTLKIQEIPNQAGWLACWMTLAESSGIKINNVSQKFRQSRNNGESSTTHSPEYTKRPGQNPWPTVFRAIYNPNFEVTPLKAKLRNLQLDQIFMQILS